MPRLHPGCDAVLADYFHEPNTWRKYFQPSPRTRLPPHQVQAIPLLYQPDLVEDCFPELTS
jgi:hypothetical protein